MFSSGTGSLRAIDREDLSLFQACSGSKRKYENRARRSISSDCKHFLLFGHTNTAPRVMCVHVVFKKIMIGVNALLSKYQDFIVLLFRAITVSFPDTHN